MNPLMTNNSGARNPLQYMNQFMQNPIGALRQAGYNIPDGMRNPQQIANYLIENGQIGGQKLQQLRAIAGNLVKR